MVAEKLNVTYSEWSPLVEEDLNVERELNNNASIPLETKVVSKGGTLIGKTTLEVVKFSPERWLNSGSNSIPVYFFDEQGSLELVPSEQISDMVRGEWLITLKWWEGIGGLN